MYFNVGRYGKRNKLITERQEKLKSEQGGEVLAEEAVELVGSRPL